MGWLWTTAVPAPSPATSPIPATEPPKKQAPAPQQAEHDAVDPEVQKFMALIQAELANSSSTTEKDDSVSISHPSASLPPTTTDSPDAARRPSWLPFRSSAPTTPLAKSVVEQLPSSRTPFTDDAANNPGTLSSASASDTAQAAASRADAAALADASLITSMSCKDAFDYAWQCRLPPGQLNSVYRYGTMRSCNDVWGDFWFCMRTRSYGAEAKEAAIRDHYRQKEAERYGPGMPSSEDVWEPREGLVPPGVAFSVKVEEPTISDLEWNLMEMHRRRKLREKLGIDTPRTNTTPADDDGP